MNKRGQFYVIAAVVLIALIAGLTAVENKAGTAENPVRFYDLSENFDRESVKIVDNGVYNQNSQAEIEAKLYDFYVNYSKYAVANEPDMDLAFVYGDKEKAIIGRFNPEQSTTKLFGLENESLAVSSKTNIIKTPVSENVNGDNVVVKIGDEQREISLKDDESFYFIVMQKKEKEVLISQNV